jgi:hypothetical protein
MFSDMGHPDVFFYGCKSRLNSEEALSGIPDIQNSETDEHLVEIVLVLPLARVQRSNAEVMSHHTSSLAHASFFDDNVVDALLAPKRHPPLHYAALSCRCRPVKSVPTITTSTQPPQTRD